jgi:dTDP-glucose pyrophosphorylase
MDGPLIGVIPAAGKGARAYPHTRVVPKAMFDICGQPLIHYTLTCMRDQLGIRDVAIVIGPHGASIPERFGDGSAYGLRIRYVENDRLELGLGYSVSLARDHVQGSHFVTMLSDELYWNSNHSGLLQSGYEDYACTLVARAESTNREIRKNFSLDVDGRLVRGVVEKPKSSGNALLGCGTYLFSREIFGVLDRRLAAGNGDLTGAVNDLIASGGRVQHYRLLSEYVNINYEGDLHDARSIVRRSRLAAAQVSLVMPCESPPAVVEDMLRQARRHPRIGEVLLVVRRRDDDLERLADTYRARIVLAGELSRQDYGSKFRAGIEQATGDIVVTTMDDDSFDLGDVDKLLAYICDADLVLGTRTTSQLAQQGSNLHWTARAGNYVLAKLIEALWPSRRARLTDVGCSFRAFWRESYARIAGGIRSTGPAFAPEMIVEALRSRLWVIEVPINYCRASDEARVRIEHRNFGVFLSMMATIVKKRMGHR